MTIMMNSERIFVKTIAKSLWLIYNKAYEKNNTETEMTPAER